MNTLFVGHTYFDNYVVIRSTYHQALDEPLLDCLLLKIY